MTVPQVSATLKQADETCSYDTGLIFRIMLDLYRRLGEDIAPLLDLLDLVALASVSVHGPATDKNRALVQQGMKLIASGKRPFFKALAQEFHPSTVNVQDAVARYVPIINSISRMDEDGDTALVVDAMYSQDMNFVEHLVHRFGELNERRKKELDRQVHVAEQKSKNRNNPAVIISDREFTVEMIDMIAGQLKDSCKQPVIVLAYLQDEYELLKGFGRSMDGFSLIDAFDNLSIYLTRYHGNAHSVEFSILEENLAGFVGDFMRLAAERTCFEKAIALDAVLDGTALTEQFIRDLSILAPFGEGFPEPLFELRLPCDSVQYMGSRQQHVKYTSASSDIAVIGWNQGDAARRRTTIPQRFTGKPSLNFWRDQTHVQFVSRCCS